MPSNSESHHRMHPWRLLNLQQEARAPKKPKTPRFGAGFFSKETSVNVEIEQPAKPKPPTKPAVYFSYTKGIRKRNTAAGQKQHHIIAKKSKRKDKRKARREMEAREQAYKDRVEVMDMNVVESAKEQEDLGSNSERTRPMDVKQLKQKMEVSAARDDESEGEVEGQE